MLGFIDGKILKSHYPTNPSSDKAHDQSNLLQKSMNKISLDSDFTGSLK
jgi:hypothetical protein